MNLDKEHNRYYFQPPEPGKPLSVDYTPLNQAKSTRNAVWQPVSKRTNMPRPYWYHLAVGLSFQRVGRDNWCLIIRPEMRITKDGFRSIDSAKVGGKVTRRKSRMFNYDLLEELQFWRDYLSDSSPRIVFPFEPGQHIIVSNRLMESEIEWPGIPEEYAKPFRNIEHEEDLSVPPIANNWKKSTSTMKTSGVRRRTRNNKTADLGPCIRSRYLGEPTLVFADGREHVDPKLGISRFGPKSWRPERRHPSSLRVGFIGPPDAIERPNAGLRSPLRAFTATKIIQSSPVAWPIAAS